MSTAQEKVARMNLMKALVDHPGFALLDNFVTEQVEATHAEIEMAKDPYDIKKLQGKLIGIKSLKDFIGISVFEGQRAQEEIRVQMEQPAKEEAESSINPWDTEEFKPEMLLEQLTEAEKLVLSTTKGGMTNA